ncbi:hypothetical protein LCGC14_1225320 [marine sediment metagenome]|uniref:Uncharacterized protein n=1 Tax=marine sediment metagenome TaxID=412755 RepID=A0A0F9PEH3_9ZZZZ
MSALNLQYWSFEALKEFYYENVELIIEFCIIRRKELCGSRKAVFTRFITYGNDSLLQRTFENRHAVLVCVYNLVLKSEGLGFLRGFGIKDYQGKQLMGNPEYSSIINTGNDSERRKENKKVVKQKQIIFNKRKESKKMVNVKFGDLKKAIQALNEMDHIKENIRYVGVKKDVLVELFLEGVEACPEENEGTLSEEIKAMYNLLSDDEETLTEADISKQEDDNGNDRKTEEKEECSDFGKGHGKDKDKCGECKEEYPEDYDECKKLSKPKKTTGKKKTGKAKAKAKKVKEKKKDQEPKYTRRDAFLDAFKKGGTKSKLIEMSNEFYEKSGGKANVKVASNQVDRYLPAFDVLGILNTKGEGSDAIYSWKKK